ncbi:unnamed protein product [Pleuronectes platessa]|uniref:Secreted protein n=1 Tax=Pleuronectes platessa TaxID=8262 RepID=A0A9N7ZB16_PLEPL|nr:unnamed protein product [Pleuronectes platessa]
MVSCDLTLIAALALLLQTPLFLGSLKVFGPWEEAGTWRKPRLTPGDHIHSNDPEPLGVRQHGYPLHHRVPLRDSDRCAALADCDKVRNSGLRVHTVLCPAEQAVGNEQQWATHCEVLAVRRKGWVKQQMEQEERKKGPR